MNVTSVLPWFISLNGDEAVTLFRNEDYNLLHEYQTLMAVVHQGQMWINLGYGTCRKHKMKRQTRLLGLFRIKILIPNKILP